MPIEIITTFILASVVLGLAPGPDNLFVLTQSALHGRKAGLLVTLGLCTGLVVHTSAVALGVAAIFQTSEMAFTVLKAVGAGYLVYLAWGAFKASAANVGEQAPQLSSFALYRRGIVMNVTNPKVSIFFLAFLPQFASSEYGPIVPQIFLLGGLFIVVTLMVFGSIALLAGTLGGWLKSSSQSQVYMNRLAGTVFAGLAIKLMTTQQ